MLKGLTIHAISNWFWYWYSFVKHDQKKNSQETTGHGVDSICYYTPWREISHLLPKNPAAQKVSNKSIQLMTKLKADRPHPQEYLHKRYNYRHAEKRLLLAIVTLGSRFEDNCLLLQTSNGLDRRTIENGRYQVYSLPDLQLIIRNDLQPPGS